MRNTQYGTRVSLITLVMAFINLGASVAALAHEGHDHGTPLAVSVAFDAQGVLWRASAQDGYVLVDSSNDFGRHFNKPARLNADSQKIVTEGDSRPKIAIGDRGNVYVTWTQALPTPYTGYVWFARSNEARDKFEHPKIVHQDRAEITHGFDAIAVAPGGRIYVAWIDKRDLVTAKSIGTPYAGAAIYYAISDDRGASFTTEQKLADNSCECCRIALSTEDNGDAVAMWRSIFPINIRDHAIARFDGSGAPPDIKRASFGGWNIEACPHQGPALAKGGTGNDHWGWHMAWFDGGVNPGIFYSRMDGHAWVSSPAKRFGNASHQASRPALLSLDLQGDKEYVWLAWKELTDAGSTIYLAFSDDGGRNFRSTSSIADTSGRSDFPQLLEYHGTPYLAWNTEVDGFVFQKLKTGL